MNCGVYSTSARRQHHLRFAHLPPQRESLFHPSFLLFRVERSERQKDGFFHRRLARPQDFFQRRRRHHPLLAAACARSARSYRRRGCLAVIAVALRRTCNADGVKRGVICGPVRVPRGRQEEARGELPPFTVSACCRMMQPVGQHAPCTRCVAGIWRLALTPLWRWYVQAAALGAWRSVVCVTRGVACKMSSPPPLHTRGSHMGQGRQLLAAFFLKAKPC